MNGTETKLAWLVVDLNEPDTIRAAIDEADHRAKELRRLLRTVERLHAGPTRATDDTTAGD